MVDQTFGKRSAHRLHAVRRTRRRGRSRSSCGVKVDRPEQQAYLVLAWQAAAVAEPDAARARPGRHDPGRQRELAAGPDVARQRAAGVARQHEQRLAEAGGHRLHPARGSRRATCDKVEQRDPRGDHAPAARGPDRGGARARRHQVRSPTTPPPTRPPTGVAGAYGITMIQATLDNELRYLDRLQVHHARADPGGGPEVSLDHRLRAGSRSCPGGRHDPPSTLVLAGRAESARFPPWPAPRWRASRALACPTASR